jgi:predicted metal-dependent hydrolase
MTVETYFSSDGQAREDYLSSLDADALLQLGIDLYNAGHYWNAHEAWETVWLDAPEPLRAFYQGLIQVTAAFVHLVRNEYPGAVRLLDAGIEKLDRYPASYLGVELAPLREGAKAARERLVELGARRIAEFERALIPRIDSNLQQSSGDRQQADSP